MKELHEEEGTLRRYLLGMLDDEGQARVEERFLADRDFREQILVAEEEFIDDYLSGELSEQERESFDEYFLQTPQQRQKLRIAKAIRRFAAEAAAVPAPPSRAPAATTFSPPQKPGAVESRPSWRKPLIASAAALLILLVLGVVWVSQTRWQWNERAALERELERLNVPSDSGPETGSAAFSFFLTPSLRSETTANIFSQPEGVAAVRLWLVLRENDYPKYRVVFQKDGDPRQFTIDSRRPEATPRGAAVPVNLPSNLFTPGEYSLKVSGVSANGGLEEVGDYSYQVAGR